MVDAGFLQAVLDSSPLGFVALRLDEPREADDRLRLVYANRAASSLIGVDLDRCIGRTVREALPWIPAQRLRAYAQVCRTREPRTIGPIALPGERGGRRLNAGAFPGPEGSVVIVFESADQPFCGDLTEWKRAQEVLRASHDELERRVAQRTDELSSTLGKLKDSETMLVQSEKMSALGQMVAGVAHEVNTPLAYVKASLEAAQSRAGDAGRLARETRALLELIESDAGDEAGLAQHLAAVRKLLADKRLESLDLQLKDGLHGITQLAEFVVSLKDFSRLERGAVVTYDVNEGVETTLRIAGAQLGKRQVRKIFGELPAITCSPSQINQVVLNLLVNAAHATPELGGSIVVRTSVPDAEHVAIEVSDNGKGIPKEVLPRIFDPFFTTKEVGKGTGLGLSICFRIIEAHGGRIQVDSRPGAGARFTIVLPLVAHAALAA